jgi:hypothetical protein
VTDPIPDPQRPPQPVDDPLATLRGHVRDAQRAAERLAAEANDAGVRGAGGSPTSATAAGADAAGAGGTSRGGFAQSGAGGATGPRGSGTPPRGWEPAPGEDARGELRALIELLEALRAILPEELREQLNDLVRQILLLVRAVIDWLMARMEREAAPPAAAEPIQDIPIS